MADTFDHREVIIKFAKDNQDVATLQVTTSGLVESI